MPSNNQFSIMRRGIRSPFVVATSAASLGVLLGGFAVMEIYAPPKPAAAPVAQASAKPALQPLAKPAMAETTGSATKADGPGIQEAANAGCDTQTWPYLSRECAELLRAKQQGPRVVATDKLDRSTIDAVEGKLSQAGTAPAAATSAVAPAASPTTVAQQPASSTPTPAKSRSAETAVASTAAQPDTTATVAPASSEAAQQRSTTATNTARDSKDKHKKYAKRKSKPTTRPDNGEDGTAVVATTGSDDETGDVRVDMRRSRYPMRSVERVRSLDDDDDVRTVVVHRSRGPFESLFGGFMGPRDDD